MSNTWTHKNKIFDDFNDKIMYISILSKNFWIFDVCVLKGVEETGQRYMAREKEL